MSMWLCSSSWCQNPPFEFDFPVAYHSCLRVNKHQNDSSGSPVACMSSLRSASPYRSAVKQDTPLPPHPQHHAVLWGEVEDLRATQQACVLLAPEHEDPVPWQGLAAGAQDVLPGVRVPLRVEALRTIPEGPSMNDLKRMPQQGQ